MTQDIDELVKGFLSDDQAAWGKLSSEVQFRRLQLLLLREILLELRKLGERPVRHGEGAGAL